MKRIIYACSLIIFFGFTLLFNGCKSNQQSSQQEVVVYTSLDKVFSQPVLEKFEKQTGIKVKAVYDSEATKTTGLVNRLIAESNGCVAKLDFHSLLIEKLHENIAPPEKGKSGLPVKIIKGFVDEVWGSPN